MTLGDKMRLYWQDPFSFFDNLQLRITHVDHATGEKRTLADLNIFRKSRAVAHQALNVAIIMLILWVAMGLDSSPAQLLHAVTEGIPAWIQGGSFQNVLNSYAFYYGKEIHGSAFVIYALAFWALSCHFDQGLNYVVRRSDVWRFGPASALNPFYDPDVQPGGLGITRSRNLAYATCLTALAVGSFEFFWIGSFAYFQNQPWIVSWQWPQLRILTQNLAFVMVGLMGVVYLWADSFILGADNSVLGRRYKFNLDWRTAGLIMLTAGLVLLWWFYPWPTPQVQVQLANGAIWTSSPRFPQTLYTIKTDPASPFNAGSWFWIQNDAVHTLNTLVKILWTMAIVSAGMIRKVQKHT